MQQADIEIKQFTLQSEQELRFDVEYQKQAILILKEGVAEIFGTELLPNFEYKFSGKKLAVFTWQFCKLELRGKFRAYTAHETPMKSYLSIHATLEQIRTTIQTQSTMGPIVMVVGPTDTGKSSLCKSLCSWAARSGKKPIFIDLDVGQNSITVPGMMAAVHIDKPIDIREGLTNNQSLVYFYGHASLSENEKLYKINIHNLARDIYHTCQLKPDVKNSGIIINTCGWIEDLGFHLLLYTIAALKVSNILVLDNERLYNELKQQIDELNNPGINTILTNINSIDYGIGLSPRIENSTFINNIKFQSNIEIIKLSKSGGVVQRSKPFRTKTRANQFKEYFCGTLEDLLPQSIEIDFQTIVIFKIGGVLQVPLTALPIDSQSTIDPTKLNEVEISRALTNSILGVSYAETVENILTTNLAGFVHIKSVDVEKSKITILSPYLNIPCKYFLLGTLRYNE
eukprot:TRINITY_DN4252_c0_g1_i1.p1 TRINITY_DN4252_c0_g1~~TRINITY_DN4252_c0_g1_i1.p1  ORF type:complete len:456 (-),score=160.93 TRINITY_DN4252_c0_g1_i1:146-1513(-)